MKKILVVEDELPISKALQIKLEKDGFAVETAYDGEEALAVLARSKFDLVLLDLILPKKDGFTVLAEISQKYSDLPVVVLSNLSQDGDFQKVKQLGAVNFLIKAETPINEVVNYIKKLLSI